MRQCLEMHRSPSMVSLVSEEGDPEHPRPQVSTSSKDFHIPRLRLSPRFPHRHHSLVCLPLLLPLLLRLLHPRLFASPLQGQDILVGPQIPLLDAYFPLPLHACCNFAFHGVVCCNFEKRIYDRTDKYMPYADRCSLDTLSSCNEYSLCRTPLYSRVTQHLFRGVTHAHI